jgi:Cu/Ag efflux pump CusA
LYLNFRRLTEALLVMLLLPIALTGGVWLLWMLDYELSVAVGVRFIVERVADPPRLRMAQEARASHRARA